MRSSLRAIAAGLLALATSSQASVYSLATQDLGAGTTQPSLFGLNLNVAGILGVPGPAAQPAPPNGFISGALSGTAVADINLDGSNSGTLDILSSTFTLADTNYVQSGTIFGFSPYTINISLTGVQIQIVGGPLSVTNGNFSIDSSSVGSLSLNNGTLGYVINVAALGVNEIGSIDLAASPLTVDFSSLGTTVIAGTTDDDASGFDAAGAEVNISFNGVSITSSLALNPTTNLPVTLNLTGGVSVSVPEAGTMTLVGLAGIAGLTLIRRRRSA
jgi:MYXO-CTERM domain-containing protein